MRKTITLKNQSVDYTLKRSWRAKRLRVVVYPGGELMVSAPFFLSALYIEHFVKQRATWILRTMSRLSQLHPLSKQATKNQYRVYRDQAKALVDHKIALLNQVYDVLVKRVSIRNQKTRWGSCSKQGSLSFNFRIVFLEPWLQDYIIVHELCHLLEFNHSPKFWQLVAKTIPTYKQARKELRKKPIGSYHN